MTSIWRIVVFLGRMSGLNDQMTKRSVLDSIDEQLVGLLRENARRTTTALSKELNLSRTAVQARLARLERARVILGYTAVLGARTSTEISAIVSLRLGERPCRQVLDRIAKWPEIVHGYSVAGPLDAVLVVKASSSAALSALADRLGSVPGIVAVETTLVLETFVEQLSMDG